MNIEKAFHDRWAAYTALNSLLPVARVFTGRAKGDPAKPYATIRVSRFETVDASNLSWMRQADVLIRIVPESYSQGKGIHDALLDGFEGDAYSATDGAIEEIEHATTNIDEGPDPDDPQWTFDVTLTALCREDRV